MRMRSSLLALTMLIGGALTVTSGIAAAGTEADCTYNTSAGSTST